MEDGLVVDVEVDPDVDVPLLVEADARVECGEGTGEG